MAAGYILGSLNFLGFSCVAVILPFFVTEVTKNGDATQWHIVYFVSAGITAMAATFFLFCGSGEIQSWAEHPRNTQNEQKKSETRGTETEEKKINDVTVVGRF